ncbi:calcitonin receptor-like protein 1 [Saccostrea cucullata]|uniref:calcitonin receptor-like protein 1 n=1 Tax=Saccostrea cuccullata TaxID=36930 RepID=UPI002ED483BA
MLTDTNASDLIFNDQECIEGFSAFPFDNVSFCGSIHDGLMCWPPTLAGKTIKRRCPNFNGFDPSKEAVRKCGRNGTWEEIVESIVTISKTNFAECVIPNDIDIFRKFDDHTRKSALTMSAVALSLLCLSILSIIVVFLLYYCILPKFVNTILHVKIHKTLFIAVIFDILAKMTTHVLVIYELNNISFINSEIFMNFVCKFLATFTQYTEIVFLGWIAMDANFLQILCKADHLCTSGFTMYCIVGWGLPIVPLTLWVVTLVVDHKVQCWIDHTSHPVMWVVDIYKLFILTATFIFLLLAMVRLHMAAYREKVYDRPKLKYEVTMSLVFFVFMFISCALVVVPTHIPLKVHQVIQHLAVIFTSSRGMCAAIVYAFVNKDFLKFLQHNEVRIRFGKYLALNVP